MSYINNKSEAAAIVRAIDEGKLDGENMFITEIDEDHANEKRTNALKPMNCPCHVQIFNQGLRSYKDLPIRFSEFGSCHRYEASGTLHGLMRVRGFTQDDGHIFCTEDQIQEETKNFIELLSDIYSQLGFDTFEIKLSLYIFCFLPSFLLVVSPLFSL